MRLIPLGTNGFFPSFGRQTACFVIPYGSSKLIILDAGSGLFRFAEDEGQKLLRGIKEIHLFLSHYHLDHTFGFYGAFKLFKNINKVRVYASSGKQVFSEFVVLKHFPIDYSKEHGNFSWHTLAEGVQDISDYQVSIFRQNHRGEVSLAFRFSFGVVYITDGEPKREIINLAQNAQVMLCESPFAGETRNEKGANGFLETQLVDGHITSIGAAMMAKKANVNKLILIHHNPFYNRKKLEENLNTANKIFSKTKLAYDGEPIEFKPTD